MHRCIVFYTFFHLRVITFLLKKIIVNMEFITPVLAMISEVSESGRQCIGALKAGPH